MKSALLLVALAALPLGFAVPHPTVAPTAAAAAVYKIDNAHTNALFRVKHMGVSWFYGRFNKIDGSVTWDDAKPEASKIEINVAADSVDTNDKKRDDHLRSPDFFSVKEFPNITFKSTSVAKKGDALSVTGDLTMHGVTKSVTVEVSAVGAKDTQMGSRAGFETTFEIKRSDFGMKYGVPDALGDEVRIVFSLEGVKG